ncbi:CinA family protein [Skermanella mucosa]|uniref:CinA family protein n=1 Tax=Skermanella mucosa TaxID=1789672 RepID=UPI001E3EB41A|nr:CinA family protein [Skermanella mucosa]UEM18606.1 CinA family protein [Skermanella mucosa]
MTETLPGDMPDDIDQCVQQVLEAACRQEIMIATAESCTGGLLASLLTDITGCSHAFERGFVTYTNHAKNEMLGVSQHLLEDPGPVSEEVARAMAEGAIDHSRAHLSIAITGFAGPGGPGDEPGLVHFAMGRKGKPTRHRMERFGDLGRGGVRLECVRTALSMLRAELEGIGEPRQTMAGTS